MHQSVQTCTILVSIVANKMHAALGAASVQTSLSAAYAFILLAFLELENLLGHYLLSRPTHMGSHSRVAD